MLARLDALLLDSDLDLSLSRVEREPGSTLTIRSRADPLRIALSLLFALPCATLLAHALQEGGYAVLIALLLCPPMAVLGVLFGLAEQERSLYPSNGTAERAYRLPGIHRRVTVRLPAQGAIVTFRRRSLDTGGCYVHYVEIKDLPGFRFCVSRDAGRRDKLAATLADVLKYDQADTGEAPSG